MARPTPMNARADTSPNWFGMTLPGNSRARSRCPSRSWGSKIFRGLSPALAAAGRGDSEAARRRFFLGGRPGVVCPPDASLRRGRTSHAPPGWKVSELARLACMSEEHRRRLCHEDYQRSPMDHLTHLRLRRAGTMLRSSPEKVEGIAHQAGYASVYCFSAAFRRWSSIPPARFRRV